MMPSQATRNLATRYTVLYTEMKKECDLLDKPFCNFLTGGGSPSRFKLAAKEYVLSRASNSQPANVHWMISHHDLLCFCALGIVIGASK